MLDPNELLRDPADAAQRLSRKGVSASEVEAAIAALRERRALGTELDELRSELKRASKEIGAIARSGDQRELERRKAAVSDISDRVQAREQRFRDAEATERDLLLRLPNWPSDETPDGTGDEDNVVVSVHGPSVDSYRDFPRRPHWEIASELGIYDGERGAKISGSMFALLRGDGSRLLHALVQYGLARNRERYEEITPPHLVRSETFTATGHLPKFAHDAYQTTEDSLWLIPTAEVPLMSIHRDEILDEAELPKSYMAYTVCFRREAGSAGKDTRGMQRLHEFHKVELVKLCTEPQVREAFDGMLGDVGQALDELGLTYRIVELCAGDLGFSATRTFDFEVYAPGADRWLEVSSVGQFSDFQTRRGSLRYRPADGGRPCFVHAMNGSAMATPRIWAAIVETGQQPDGSIRLPEPLVTYMGQETIPRDRMGRPAADHRPPTTGTRRMTERTDERVDRRLAGLTASLRERGLIRSAGVERAFGLVRRDRFINSFFERGERWAVPQDGPVPDAVLDRIYADQALITHLPDDPSDPTGLSSSSTPGLMADMLEALELAAGMRVLEIGAGTGYNAALIATITTAPVMSIDVNETVVEEARAALSRLAMTDVTVTHADGYAGHPPAAPYDRIVVTVGCTGISPRWLDQLAPGGLIVAPIAHTAPITQAGFSPVLAIRREGDAIVGRAVRSASFMPAAGPLYRMRDGSAPPDMPTLPTTDHTCHDLGTTLADDDYDHLLFALAARDGRVSAAFMEGIDPAGGLMALVDGERGVAFIQKDAIRLVGDSSLVDEITPLIAEWQERGRPRIGNWTCTLTKVGAAGSELYVPTDWTLDSR